MILYSYIINRQINYSFVVTDVVFCLEQVKAEMMDTFRNLIDIFTIPKERM